MAAEPVERRRSGQLITLTGYFAGLPVESTLRVSLRPPHLLEFVQTWGTLRAVTGHCALRPVEDGTEVQYRLEVDPGIAMISDESARQFLVQFLERMLDRIKLAAERKAPARRAERAEAQTPAGAAAAADAADEEDGDAPEAADGSEAPAALAAAPSPVHAERPAGRAERPAAHAERPAGEAEGAGEPAPGARSRSRRRRRRRHRGRPGGAPARGDRGPAARGPELP
jgi:hypothetical protein